jgi:hypothetical protein
MVLWVDLLFTDLKIMANFRSEKSVGGGVKNIIQKPEKSLMRQQFRANRLLEIVKPIHKVSLF